jgi:hypothetical protein
VIHRNGAGVRHLDMSSLSAWQRALLASAYELPEEQVEQDAARLQQWLGTDQELATVLEVRHGWTVASECGPYYIAAVRQALA